MRNNKVGLLAATILLVGASASLAGASETGGRLIPPSSLTKEQQQAPHSRMSSEFHNLVRELRGRDSKGRKDLEGAKQAERATPLFVTRGAAAEEIETYIWLDRWSERTIEDVKAAGAEVSFEDPDRFLLQAWVPLDRAEEIAAVQGVRQLRRPSYGIPSAGSVTSEGDSALGTNLIRISRIGGGFITGGGIRVGVLSSGLFCECNTPDLQEEGVNGDPLIQSGNIPAFNNNTEEPGPTSRYFGAIEIFPASFTLHQQPSGEIREGALMLETIYDVAPGATIFYGDGRTDVQLQAARNFLEGRGVDVIVDDMVFFDSGRFDGTSTVSRRAQSMVLTKDIVYIVAAGNQAPFAEDSLAFTLSKRSPLFVNGHFAPDPSPSREKYHNFAAEYDPAQRDEFLILSSVNGVLDVSLTWDDVWDDRNPRAQDDLDLYLFTITGTGTIGGLAASSVDVQQNSGLPKERITHNGGGTFALAIKRKDITNSSSRPFTLTILQGGVIPTDARYLTHGIPLNNADALPPVISVGAIDVRQSINTPSAESIPGLDPGPGRQASNSFFKWYSSQTTPAVVSYSNTSASSWPRFTGSSAGAAHIGGLVALLRHTDRSIPSYRFYDILRDTSAPSFPNATEIYGAELSQFGNRPRLLRVNGYDTWFNLRLSSGSSGIANKVRLNTTGDVLGWESSGQIEPFLAPTFGMTEQGLSLSAAGQYGVFGFWQTDLFELPLQDGSFTSELQAGKVYELRARVGSDESDPNRVPNFRLRLITGGNDEAVTMDIAGGASSNTPTTIGGKEYVLYYRPSNPEVAKQGVRFAFDLVHVNETDNADATLFLQEVTFREQGSAE